MINIIKNALFCELQLVTVLLLICDSYMSPGTKFVSRLQSEIVCGISHWFRFVFI